MDEMRRPLHFLIGLPLPKKIAISEGRWTRSEIINIENYFGRTDCKMRSSHFDTDKKKS